MDVVFKKDSKKSNPFKGIWDLVVNKVKNFKLPNSFYYFLILLFIGLGFYIAMLIENNFTLAYGGDYSAQYIPMGFHIWDYYHEWIKTGHFTLFDSTLYLGANSFGSNAYYGLFSPFNIIICIFPRTFVPHAVAISSIIKLACAGMFFSMYMKHAFNVKDSVSRICGIAYAFCGWGAFYLWYNNYQDILVFFPLVLLGIEKTIKEQKPWLLAVGVFLLAISNYVLMVSYIICAFFYAMFRFFQQIKTKNVKENFTILGLGVAGFASGLFMALFVFGPALMATMASPKLETNSYGAMLKDYLFSGKIKEFLELLFSWGKAKDQHGRVFVTRHWYPILEFFFPATTCRSLPTLELNNWDFDDIAVSLWSYVPFMLFLVPALIQSGKEKKWSHYIGFGLLVLSLFTPFMYFVTMMFTNGYARWTLFIVSSLIAYVGIYIDKIPNVARWHIHVGYTFAIAGIITCWILTWKLYVPNAEKSGQLIHRFVEDGFDFTNLAYGGELIYVTAVYLTLFFLYNKKKAFSLLVTLFISAEAITVGNFVTMGHGYDTRYNNGYAKNEQFRTVLKQIQKDDQSYYRVYSSINDAYSVMNGFVNNYNTVSFFHSLYNFEIDDFTLWTGLRNGTKSVSGYYRGKYQDMDNLLGVKYYFISKEKSRYAAIEAHNPGQYVANVPFDFVENTKYEELDKSNSYFIFDNKNLSQFGYSYKNLYDGIIRGADDGVRFNIESMENTILLAKNAYVYPEDAVEIKEQYPSLNISEEKPEPALDRLVQGTNYVRTYYDIGKTAKYLTLEEVSKLKDRYDPTPNFDSDKTMNYFVTYEPRTVGNPLFKKDTILYIRGPFSGSQKYNFYFMDQNGKVFMFDSHDDDSTDNVSYIRAFYIRKDVYSLAVCGKYYQSYLYDTTLAMYSEDKASYEVRRDILNEDPIENVTYKKDKFTFTTNYSEPRFVVSRVAYDKGWSIKAKDENGKPVNIKVYKGNGGFISFIAPVGNISYTMTYQTPYLTGSYILSALATTGFFVSLFAYHLYQEKKKGIHLDKIFRGQ